MDRHHSGEYGEGPQLKGLKHGDKGVPWHTSTES